MNQQERWQSTGTSSTPPPTGQEGDDKILPLTSDPVAEAKAAVNSWSTYGRLLRYITPYWVIFLISVMGFALGGGAEAYFVSIFAGFIDAWGKDSSTAVGYIPQLLLGLAIFINVDLPRFRRA